MAWKGLLAWLVAGSAWAMALEPSTPLAGYGRQAWVIENGLPQNTVQALVQGKDGFVWLGTEAGLVRFDGLGFQLFDRMSHPALPGNDVQCLLAAEDGSLWVGTSEGLVRWSAGATELFGTRQGLPGNNIKALVESGDGAIWAWSDGGLARFDRDHFIDQTPALQIPAGAVTRVTSDGEGELWVISTQGALTYRAHRWGPGHSPGPISRENIEFVQRHGNCSATAGRSTLLVVCGEAVSQPLRAGEDLPGSRMQALLFDREGTLWIATNGGLARWSHGKVERLPITDPLAGASVLGLMEDREGDVWAGTEESGLHILRDQRFRVLTSRRGLSSDNTTAVAEDASGTLWVGTAGGGLDALPHDGESQMRARTFTARDGLPSDVILSLAAGRNGDLWAGTPDGLGQVRSGRVTSFTSADGLPDDFIRSLLVDADGSLWIGTRHGLAHWTGLPGVRPGGQASGQGNVKTFTHADGLGSDLVGAMARDRAGDLWVATLAGLSRLHEGKIRNYTTADGLSSNVITALLAREDGTLLVGTQDHGWDLWDGTRFGVPDLRGAGDSTPNQSGQEQVHPDEIGVHAILDDGQGHLWFATGAGIARCDFSPAMRPDGTAGCSRWLEFGTADGLVSRETATNSHPSAWRGQDGKLWFATPKGLEEADPAYFPVNAVPPPVALESFAVDDVAQPLGNTGEHIRVSAGHNHFQFEYAGLSYVAPQKVRYRFMLENFDRGWTEAGTRRTAYYTNIPPGHYTFRVQAANNDGLWNTEGAALPFELQPHFYQTVWFYILVTLGLAALVMLALRLRLVRAEREFRAVLAERNRIAREIHDTLAQGYVGISVQLEVLSELLRLNKVDAAAKHLDTTRTFVREGLADARQSIWSLRSQDASETTLPVRVRRLVEQAEGHDLEAKFSLFGAYRPLPPEMEREILRVAQEAIHNVKKHAEARNLAVQLEYGPSEIALEVRDDGRGFETNPRAPQNAAPDSPPGHYGLTGMKERAAAVGGKLEVTSGPGDGTTLRLRTPAKEIKE